MRRMLTSASCAAVCLLALAGASSASAAAPWWHLTSRQVPAHIAPGGEGKIIVQAINLGNASTTGKYEISDVLPAGIALEGVELFAPWPPELHVRNSNFAEYGYCKTTASSVSCSTESSLFPGEPGLVLKPAAPFEVVEMRLRVKAEAGAEPGALNEFAASGGGAAVVTREHAIEISSSPVGFNIGEFTFVPEEEGGEPDTHVGSHPYQLTSTLSFSRDSLEPFDTPAPPRNLHFKLPPGLIGNASALPQCNDQQFGQIGIGREINFCPSNTAIGVAVITASAAMEHTEEDFTVPIFNLTPAQGEPARFGFEILNNPIIIDTAVRSGAGEDYGITASVNNITEVASFISATTTFWGVPGAASHDTARSWGCLQSGDFQTGIEGVELSQCEPANQSHPAGFLTMPTNCAEPFAPTLDGTSWPVKGSSSAEPAALSFPTKKYELADRQGHPLSLTGCNQLAFAPAFEAKPTSESASSPTGLDVNLNFEDEGLTSGTGIAQSQLKDTTVTLPEGLTINPSAGVGLGGCTPADLELETLESPQGAGCPNDSKLGTVEITTPLLTQTIHGSLFIAQPYENPFGSLVAIYIVAKNPETGIVIKLAGKVTPDPVTGRLTTTFEENPQLPFSHFNFHFREGQQAPLVTPATCGSYTTDALLTPWSEPLQGLAATSSFPITSGVGGGACPAGETPPFAPQITAGLQSNTAGTFSPFSLRLTRSDAEQEISGFSTNLPAGLTGDLTGIPFCSDASIALARTKSGAQEEAQPSCPAASQIGHTFVGTGVGPVLAYVPGKIYLAGPYDDDPFSIVSVTSAVVGPFDLGTVVIRFGLRIDPYTAQVSVDPSASEPIPTIIDGIVTHVRDIRVYIERPGDAPFTLNPTSCAPTAIASTLTSSLGASSTIASPFQAASCASLKFAPKFAVATSGRTSRANGASLSVKLTYPRGPQGAYANIARVKVDLPKQLPSRLTTLQKACTAKQFETNPAGCPQASIVGHAKAVTPLIPVPLEGPAYFVSHGGEAFPSLIFVLQGYGVTIDLVGSTFISKTGITSSTFKTVPDQPIGSFELTLPQGRYSALAANGNLCASKLTMPTEFLAQNGAKIDQSTKISVTGCAKKKALTRPQRLKAALKACKTKQSMGKRRTCEKVARKDQGPLAEAKKRKRK
jgi:hypothetical protein